MNFQKTFIASILLTSLIAGAQSEPASDHSGGKTTVTSPDPTPSPEDVGHFAEVTNLLDGMKQTRMKMGVDETESAVQYKKFIKDLEVALNGIVDPLTKANATMRARMEIYRATGANERRKIKLFANTDFTNSSLATVMAKDEFSQAMVSTGLKTAMKFTGNDFQKMMNRWKGEPEKMAAPTAATEAVYTTPQGGLFHTNTAAGKWVAKYGNNLCDAMGLAMRCPEGKKVLLTPVQVAAAEKAMKDLKEGRVIDTLGVQVLNPMALPKDQVIVTRDGTKFEGETAFIEAMAHTFKMEEKNPSE